MDAATAGSALRILHFSPKGLLLSLVSVIGLPAKRTAGANRDGEADEAPRYID